IFVDDILLELHHGGKIERNVPIDLDPLTCEPLLQMGEFLRAVEHRLGGDAADVEAGPAEEFALHAGDFHPELRCANGRHVPTRAGTDDDQVKAFAVSHNAADSRD